MHVVGFSGTRVGCAPPQLAALRGELFEHSRRSFPLLVHGCCAGADREAHAIWRRHHGKVRFRPGNAEQHSWGLGEMRDFESIFDPQPYLLRNTRIVEDCAVLIACPDGPERLRSGTWSTVRNARAARKLVTIIWPDGTVTTETPTSADAPRSGVTAPGADEGPGKGKKEHPSIGVSIPRKPGLGRSHD